MSENRNDIIVDKERMQRGELQMTLMRMVAEQNKEKFLEYDCEKDLAILSAIENGHFKELERIEGYYTKNNLSISHVAEEDRALYRKEVERCMRRPMTRVIELRYLDNTGEKSWHRVYLVSIGNEERQVIKLAARFISVQQEKEAQELLKAKAERDSLSGVYNHKTYEKKVNKIIDTYGDNIAFVMIDIDNFKQINDSNGHHVGDGVVRYTGDVLEAIVRQKGVAGRIGGDEFSACFYNMEDKQWIEEVCVRIKEGLKQTPDGLPFTVSIGVSSTRGRQMNFAQLYYEADEAVYYAKEHGKNQIVFSEELEELKKLDSAVEKIEYALSEEEIELDERNEYCVITSPFDKKVLYMNKSARDVLGISLEEAKELYCYELFKGQDNPCGVCELHGNQVHILEGEHSCGLAKYIPNGKFIIQGQYTLWKGESARLTTFMNVNEHEYVTQYFEERIESQEALSKCWNLIMESSYQEMEYTKVLEVLKDYYDADCCAIVSKNDEKYDKVFECHKNAAQNVAEGLRFSLEAGVIEACEALLDEEGYMRPHHIKKKLEEYPDLAKALQEGFVHNTIGMALSRQGYIVGVLMIVNPRHHMNDYTILKRVGVFFTADLLRKRLTDVKSYEENHDTLTRLWNREYYAPWINRFGHHLKNNFGVFTADIFRLGEINKAFGYETGNARLVELATAFRRVFGGYSIFRYDDDQILALIHDTQREAFEKLVSYAKEVIAELDFEVSCGYWWQADGSEVEAVRNAIEQLDRDRHRLEKENDLTGKLAKRVEKDVIEEVKKGNFRMFLQPKVSSITGETIGAEGLVRLYNDERGFVSPAYFIPILEENNAIHLIDMFILQRAFQFQADARKAGRRIVPISVNFSKNTLMFQHLIEYIKRLCDDYGMPEGNIIIEITETISNMDHLEVNRIAKALHSIGFTISMDDFGTQYSNMAVLTQFDFDNVKIDRSMIMDIAENEKKQKVLKHMINMFKDLGLKIVAEGVENAEQVEILRDLGCEIIQGFYFGKPEPEEKFYELFM